MSYSKVQLRNEIAKNLELVAAGQTLSTGDAAEIDQSIDAAVAYLQHENLVNYNAAANATTSVIPDGLFHPLAEYAESYAAPAFGKPRDAGLRGEGLKKIRRVVLSGKPDTPTKITFY